MPFSIKDPCRDTSRCIEYFWAKVQGFFIKLAVANICLLPYIIAS